MNSKHYSEIRARIRALANSQVATVLQGFFKTGPGEYNAGDVFVVITVPPLRQLARDFQHVTLRKIKTPLHPKFTRSRTLALMILVRQFDRANEA